MLAVNDDGVEIACGSGSITLTEVEINGKLYHGDQIPLS